MRFRKKTTPERLFRHHMGVFWPELREELEAYAAERGDNLEKLAETGDIDLKYKVLHWLWTSMRLRGYPPSGRREDLLPLSIELLGRTAGESDTVVLSIPQTKKRRRK